MFTPIIPILCLSGKNVLNILPMFLFSSSGEIDGMMLYIFFRLQCRGVLMKVYMKIKHKLMFKKLIGTYRPMKRFLLVRRGLNLKIQITETH